MQDGIVDLVVYLSGAAIVGLFGWVALLWKSHMDLKVKVAEEYLKHDALQALTNEMHSLRSLVYRIAVKMDVPVVTDGSWR